MVAKSPETAQRRDDYAEGWVAINRLIRSDGSWSGRERDLFYLNLGNGRFIDLSGVSGLDFPQDGRAYGRVDLDNDGDLDLILKNRNAPQLRLLRNDTPGDNHSIAFRLIGRASGTDAVGAVVTIETDAGKRMKTVQIGSGFLSQHTRDLYFGLGREAQVQRVTVAWPRGGVESFGPLAADQRVTIVEGTGTFAATPFQPRNSDQRACAPQQPPPSASPPQGVALYRPVALPPFSVEKLTGEPVRREGLLGRPTLLNFWATWCAPCQTEMKLWKEHYQEIRAAGAELMAISVDETEQRGQVEKFVAERGLPFPVLVAKAETLEHLNVLYRLLFERSTDMEIPLTLLLNGEGEVVKLYRGVVPVDGLLADLRALRTDPQRLQAAALPYPGIPMRYHFRDYRRMGDSYYLLGMLEEAMFYLERGVETSPDRAQGWSNLGVIYGRQGRLQEALRAFQRALEANPKFSEPHFNLGMAYLSLGQVERAEQSFARAVELDPADAPSKLQYGLALAANGKTAEAISMLEAYLELKPDDAEALNDLGVLHSRSGAVAKGMEYFRRATELKPDYAEALRNLGIAYLQLGMPFRASETLERVMAVTPQDAAAALALAEAYLQRGQVGRAEEMARRAVELDPTNARARAFLEQLERNRTGR